MLRECQGQMTDNVRGMCFYNGLLYTSNYKIPIYDLVPRSKVSVYGGINEDNLIHLDTMDTDGMGIPSVDHHTGQFYFPSFTDGVRVVRYNGTKLRVVKVINLRGVHRIAVVSSDALYVCDHEMVYLVDVNQDRVTAILQAPSELSDRTPRCIAVLGDTILVAYYFELHHEENLVIYRHGIPTPGRMVPLPPGLRSVSGLSTDNHHCFLVTDVQSSTVFVLNLNGKLIRVIRLPVNDAVDCTVVNGQLLVLRQYGRLVKLLP